MFSCVHLNASSLRHVYRAFVCAAGGNWDTIEKLAGLAGMASGNEIDAISYLTVRANFNEKRINRFHRIALSEFYLGSFLTAGTHVAMGQSICGAGQGG